MKPRHKCNCCGCYTLVGTEEDIAWDICPVCYWENDVSGENPEEYSGANHLTLAEGRANLWNFSISNRNTLAVEVKPIGLDFQDMIKYQKSGTRTFGTLK